MATRAAQRPPRRPGALYFPVVTTLLVGLSFMAFWDNLVTDVGQPSNSDPKMVVHALFAAAWVIAFAAQAWLVYLGRIAVHRRIGQWIFAIGGAMVLSTLYLFIAKFRGFAAMEPEVIANRLLMVVFVVCNVLAYLRRSRPDWHKRLLLVGTMALLEPVLARLYDPLFGPFLPKVMSETTDMALFLTYLFGVWLAFLSSLALYDRRIIGRVHPATLGGSGAIAACNVAAFLI
ncbi:MAG: hypothetical protein ACKOQ3_06265 [Novosphingobium sp.]